MEEKKENESAELHEEERGETETDEEELARAYPEVNARELEQNGTFRRFCGSRYGNESTAKLYEDYLAFAEAAVNSAESRADDRRRRSTGSGAGRGGNGLNAAQQKALDEWNRAYPNMRMTAREFLSR